ncbi:MAG: hypothetical protein ACD_77C00114G0001 [uncultured bacterium]|nr:MAG: hypothetical protein ACD_77C00114G0001 [uncultured bacterium]
MKRIVFLLVVLSLLLSACVNEGFYKAKQDYMGPVCGIYKGDLVYVYEIIEEDVGGAVPIVFRTIHFESYNNIFCKQALTEDTFEQFFVRTSKP